MIEDIAVTDDQREVNRLERFWIGMLRTTDPAFGYNDTFGGEGGKMTAEACAKKNAASKAWWTPERRLAHGLARKGKMMGPANPMYGKSSWTGKRHSAETRAKLRATKQKQFADPEFKRRMAEANTGKHHTAEGRANIAAALKGNQYRKGIPHSQT